MSMETFLNIGRNVQMALRRRSKPMHISQETNLGCGYNNVKYAGKAKYCTENGLDFHIYKLGLYRIKK